MKIVKILAIIGFILFLMFNFLQYDKTIYKTKPALSKLTKDAELYSNSCTPSASEKRVSVSVATVSAGTPVQIMETYLSWCKVQLSDGTMGWTEERNLEITASALCRYPHNPFCAIYEEPKTDSKQLLRLKKRTYLQILAHQDVTASRGYETGFTKVKAPDGTIGWIKDYHLERAGWEQPRRIKRKEWRYTKDSFNKKWIEQDFEKFTKKFAEPAAMKNEEDKQIYYFNNIFLYDKDRVELGLQVTVSNHKIEAVNRSHRITKWIGKFPLSSFLRSSLLNNHFWYFFSLGEKQSYDKYGDEVKPKAQRKGIIRWIFMIVFGAIFLTFYYSLVAVPYFIWDKFTRKQSLDTSKSNGQIKFIATTGAIVLGYLWFVFLNVNFSAFFNWFALHFLFCIGLTIGFIDKWVSDLMYKRCSRCRYWSGKNESSELLGVTEHTKTTTYSDGHKTHEKGKTEHWRDYQYCERTECGHRWHIDRTWWSGWRR